MKNLFPININIINDYPQIKLSMRKELKKNVTSKQIFRLLDNLSCSSIKELADYIESFLSNSEYKDFITQKINTNGYLTFKNNLKEIYLLDYLIRSGYQVSTYDNHKGNTPVPEFLASNDEHNILVELYSPIELYGFDIFLRELNIALLYSPIQIGFDIYIQIKSKRNDFEWIKDPAIPFEINEKYSNDKLREECINAITSTLLVCSEITETKRDYFLTNDVYIHVEIKLLENPAIRKYCLATPSYDSVRHFMNLENSSSGFYKKLLTKINQCQLLLDTANESIKILLIDFESSMGSDVLVEGMRQDFLSKTFYEGISKILANDVSPEKVDLIFPVLSRMRDKYVMGNCIYNSKNIDVSKIFNATQQAS